MSLPDVCEQCRKPSARFHLVGRQLLCKYCAGYAEPADCQLFQNSTAAGKYPATEAHIRDIRARRYHPTEKRMFYYTPPKTYFLPKG